VPKALIVVPCYNEAARLDPQGFRRFLAEPSVDLLFVNDGSKDDTSAVLAALCATMPGRANFVDLVSNVGKAEAVRRGMLHAADMGAEVTGFFDADLATPPEEMARIARTIDDRGVEVALGSRVQLLGTQIERSLVRHWLGRVFATFSAWTVNMPVYDTQCGAKAFRVGPAFRSALAAPFHSRWFFDVELIGRLHGGNLAAPGLPLESFVEVPLLQWRGVPGSKLRPIDFLKSFLELYRIHRALRSWRAGTVQDFGKEVVRRDHERLMAKDEPARPGAFPK
jgi:glycosyltransferase involved in cell wall biosynthesis